MNRTYWPYRERYPRPAVGTAPWLVLLHLADRLDDGIIALAAELEYRRIECRQRIRTQDDSQWKMPGPSSRRKRRKAA